MILKKYLDKIEFDSYQEFKAEFKIKIPENFNFAFDVVDDLITAVPDADRGQIVKATIVLSRIITRVKNWQKSFRNMLKR